MNMVRVKRTIINFNITTYLILVTIIGNSMLIRNNEVGKHTLYILYQNIPAAKSLFTLVEIVENSTLRPTEY